MPTKTKRPASKPAPKSTETDDELLARSLRFTSRLTGMQETGGTDEEILVEINHRWRTSKTPGGREYHVATNTQSWGTAIWFDTVQPDEDTMPNLYAAQGAKGIVGTLIPAVRRVFGIATVEEIPVEPKTAAKPAKAKATKPKLDHVPAGVTFGPVESRPVDWFFDSPHQERREPSEEWLDELGDSLLKVQLEPLVALPTGELISGHTRLRAAKRKGIKNLDVRIVDCDDATAQRLVLLFNAKRQDLSTRERCRHYAGLLERYLRDGLTHGQLADDLSLDSSTLSNEVRLQSIPDELWSRHEAGGLNVKQLRRLSVHAAREPFVAGFVGYLKTVGCAEDVQPNPDHFEKAFAKGIERAFRTMTKDPFGGGCLFKPNAAQKKELDLVEVERFGGKELMAANVKLWTELNAAAVAVAEIKASETAVETEEETAPLPAAGVTVSSNVEKEAAKQRRAEAVQHAWSLAYADSISHRFMGKMKRQDLVTVLRLVALIQREVQGFNPSFRMALDNLLGGDDDFLEVGSSLIETFFDPQEQENGWTNLSWGELLKLADWLEVSPAKYWRPTRILLETCTDKELGNFLKELQLLPSDREANIEQLLNDWKVGQVPNAFVLKRGKA